MRKLLFISLIAIAALSCEKGSEKRCEELKGAVKTDDKETVKKIVTKLTYDLERKVTANDPVGHSENYQILIDRLNGECGVVASDLCYACVQTFPATSEIKLVIELGTHSIIRVLDITTNQAGKLVCSNMHE